jgi:hypothetical protein
MIAWLQFPNDQDIAFSIFSGKFEERITTSQELGSAAYTRPSTGHSA